jgi:16S rRNA (cytosine967-C5)-methyltransferase
MKLSSLLGHAQELLELIRGSAKPADSHIDSFFRSHKYLGSHDRRFIAETLYGTLRHLRRCDAVLQRAMKDEEMDLLRRDGLLMILATYLLIIERRVALSSADLAPLIKSSRMKSRLDDLLVRIAETPELDAGEPAERIGIRYSFPSWMVERLLSEYGEEETKRICASLNEQAPLTLRVNILKTSVEECQQVLEKEGITTVRTKLSPVGLEVGKRTNVFRLRSFQGGLFEVQDEGSQLLPLIVDPKPTAKLLDACAGAGGKTLQFSALMKNRGEIVAADINRIRLDQLRKRGRRAGVSNVRVNEIQSLADLDKQYRAYFDIVFIDAPCSGLGTIRRNPGMKWMVTEESISELSEKQLQIASASSSLVKQGGILVYATCTLLREENEGVVEKFLRQHAEFHLVDAREYNADPQVQQFASSGYIRLLPHVHGTDGFFCAVLKKSTL